MADANPNPTMARLEDQISWLDRKSVQSKWWFTRLKVLSISAAAAIPVIGAFNCLEHVQVMLSSVLGALAVVVEAVQHLNQYHANWIRYRATCEALIREKQLFLAGAGPYRKAEERSVKLSERVESILAQENAQWLAVQPEPGKDEKPA